MRIVVDTLEELQRAEPIAGAGPADFALLAVSETAITSAAAAERLAAGAGAWQLMTSCRGVLSQGGAAGRGGGGRFRIFDPEGDYGSASASFDGVSAYDAARQATRTALASIDRAGEAPDLTWLNASPGFEEEVIRGVQSVIGDRAPIVGGSAADDHVAGRWRVGAGQALHQSGVAVSVLFPSTPIAYAFQSGYAPTGASGIANRVKDRRVQRIDDRPAVEVLSEWLADDSLRRQLDEPEQILGRTALSPLGREVARVASLPYYLLAHPAALHPDQSLALFATVNEGERLHLMEGSENGLIARAGRVAEQAVARSGLSQDQISGALLVYCGGGMMAVESRMDEAAHAVSAALGAAPFLGVFTFGEQGPVLGGMNRHGNLMIACIVFGA